MSTALSMHSPHHAGVGAFASSLQLSPAFRSFHTAALRQRQAEIDRLRELARSDEFSDDESDGEEDEDDDDDDDEDDDDDAMDEGGDVVMESQPSPVRQQERPSPRDQSSDSDIDSEETVLLPFIRPTIVNQPHTQETISPKADDWTIVDKSPTCEGQVFAKAQVSESWFATP